MRTTTSVEKVNVEVKKIETVEQRRYNLSLNAAELFVIKAALNDFNSENMKCTAAAASRAATALSREISFDVYSEEYPNNLDIDKAFK